MAERVPPPRSDRTGWLTSLSFRLFWVTIAVILVIELLIFVPSAVNYRSAWLEERIQAARIAALALEASPSRDVSRELSSALLARAEVLAVTEIQDGMRFQILPAQFVQPMEMRSVDLRDEPIVTACHETLRAFFASDDQALIVRAEGMASDRLLEVLVLEAPLRDALQSFGWRILGLSLLISLGASGLIYFLLFLQVVRPVRRVTVSVEQFRDDPGSWTRRLTPTTRRDEIGRAQNALADMESAVATSFRQRERLAELGEAVARINHDLRGSLATAQLVADTLARSDDPRVQRAAPRLERAIERAIALATDTLQYGKAKAPAPELAARALRPIVQEAADEALARFPDIDWRNDVPADAAATCDADSVHRIVANLVRNAAQAMDGAGAVSAGWSAPHLTVADTGPGLPDGVSETLFKPFSQSKRRDGTGLGLAIARDLARAMGGDLRLASTGDDGTTFTLILPDNGAGAPGRNGGD